ncbi:MAG: OmpP1/FadL family transporter [Bacteroidia bacterium]
MKINTKLFFVLLGSIPALVSAQGFQVNLQGQKQQGMGGAGSAYMQDGAAVFFNPGGVSFLKENSVNLSANAVIANSAYLDANTNSFARSTSPVATPFAAYAVWGITDTSKSKYIRNLKIGFGAYTPFGSIVSWQDGWTGRFALTSLKLKSIFYQPTVSYRICDKLGIGAGFVYATGDVELKQDLPVIDANGNYGKADLKGKAKANGYNVGVYYQPSSKLSLALAYRSQINMKLTNGEATFTVPSALAPNFPNGPFTAKLSLPSVTTLGAAYTATEKLAFALDINYIGWKCYDTLAFDYKTNTTTLADTKLPRCYKNTFAFRYGAQYNITGSFVARLGMGISLTPIKNGYVTPELPDANRVNLMAGIGYKIRKHFMIDASYTFEHFTRKDRNIALNLDGTYKTYISAMGLSFIYNF